MTYDLSKWRRHIHEPTGHPIEKHVCVDFVAVIRKNETGEIRRYDTWGIYEPEDGPHPSTFMYVDGNYSCDCNRYLFFQRAADEDEDEDMDCTDGRYSLNLVNPVTGETFYREFDEPKALK